MATAKKKQITSTIAGILATRIYIKVTEQKNAINKQLKQQYQDIINNDPDVAKGLKMVAELQKLNEKLCNKYDKKWFNNSYTSGMFSYKAEINKHVQEYKLKTTTEKLTEERIKNDLLLEGWFSDDIDADSMIENYVKKYTKN